MKRTFILIACIFTASGLQAGTLSGNGTSVRLSFGATPSYIGSESREFVRNRPETLYGIYGDMYLLQSFMPSSQLEAARMFGKNFVAGVSLSTSNACGFRRNVHGTRNISKKSVHDYFLLANARYSWFDGGDFKVYSGAAVGGGIRHIGGSEDTSTRLIPGYELSPVGIILEGRYFDFFCEAALGTQIRGCRIGISTKF